MKAWPRRLLPTCQHPPKIDACAWLTDAELVVYTSEFTRTSFQGGLQWYRSNLPDSTNAELDLFAGQAMTVPSLFIAGESDWGVYQKPGSFETMQATACANMRGAHLIAGAGHWVQQERPRETLDLLRQASGPSQPREGLRCLVGSPPGGRRIPDVPTASSNAETTNETSRGCAVVRHATS